MFETSGKCTAVPQRRGFTALGGAHGVVRHVTPQGWPSSNSPAHVEQRIDAQLASCYAVSQHLAELVVLGRGDLAAFTELPCAIHASSVRIRVGRR